MAMEKVKLLWCHGFLIKVFHAFWFIVKFDVLEVVDDSRLCRDLVFGKYGNKEITKRLGTPKWLKIRFSSV